MSRLRDNPWVLPASLVVALLLGLLPLPALLQPLRPYWLALVLAYWVIEAPERVGLGVAFASGVIADLLYGGVLALPCPHPLLPDVAADAGHRRPAVQRPHRQRAGPHPGG
ncbi:hypothetical protein G6F63_016017 [Rhizopus arrhizus]|nr:hypothetical protein G6F63_016017 [Rhizopus arrhizus]